MDRHLKLAAISAWEVLGQKRHQEAKQENNHAKVFEASDSVLPTLLYISMEPFILQS